MPDIVWLRVVVLSRQKYAEIYSKLAKVIINTTEIDDSEILRRLPVSSAFSQRTYNAISISLHQ